MYTAHRTARRLAVLALAAILMLPTIGRAEPAKVIAQIPADAPAAIIFRDVGAISKKIAMLNDKLKLDQPEMADALGMLKAMGGIGAGMNDGGDLAVVMTALPDPNQPGAEPDAVILAPVSDYKAFVGNFGVNDADPAAITSIELQGQPAFARHHNGYAVIGNKRNVVEAFKGGAPGGGAAGLAKAGVLGTETLGTSDVCIYLDFDKIGPMVAPMVQMGLMQAQAQMEQSLPPGAEADLAKSMLALYGDMINAFLRDASGMVIGLDLNESGIGFSLASQFRAGSPLASTFAKAPAKPLALDKLPTRPYMLAMAMDMDTLPMKKWMGDLTARFPEGHWMGAVVKASAGTIENAKGTMQMAYFGPSAGGAGPATLFSAVSVVESDNPAAYVAATRKSMEALNGVDLGGGLVANSTYQQDVMQVAGHKVDQYTTRFTIPPELAQQLGPAVMLLSQGSGGYITTTDKAVVMTSGADPVLIKQAIEAAQGKGGGIDADAGIAATRPHLHGHRIAETYIGVGTIMQMVNGLLGMFAPNAVVPIPADLPPVAASASVHSGGMSVRQYVPMPVIVAVKDAVVKVMEQQGLAGAGGAPAVEDAPAAPESKNLVVLTAANFDAQAVKSDKPVLIDFWAVWCGPCKQQAPIVSQLADQYAGKAVVGKLDIDKDPKIAEDYDIQAIPTLLILKDGKVAAKFVGVTSKEKIAAALEEAMK